ncbi:hypothetical protein J2754_001179 [Halarchaeum solikamskense]|uniref:hypothetical protein n=1 Tax=Halarchaeum nitratireducens TaxID=489913 RepID=UPI001B3B0714|nr:hypothetical protein [Halarchaeum solikamskense]MBP2250862.1 hypothetical protein [Halarchaeum solikamskense]
MSSERGGSETGPAWGSSAIGDAIGGAFETLEAEIESAEAAAADARAIALSRSRDPLERTLKETA